MREIEFRIKHGTEGKWVYGYPVFYEDGSFTFIDKEPLNRLDALEMCEISSAYDRTLGQFTGLKDKNGVKIYEGDILTNNCCNRQCEFHIQGYVQFDKEWGYVLKMYEEDDGESTWRFDVDVLEIIGNIYDNPELIKESE